MKSATHDTNEKYRKIGFKIGVGARIWGELDISTKSVSVGKYTTIGSTSYVATHCPIRGISIGRLFTEIGSDVWIGKSCLIAPGTVIGRRTILGLGSVASGILEKDSIYVGNSVRRVKIRNPIETVRTRLFTRQNLTSVPHQPPKWDLTYDDIADIFDDLINAGITIDKFKFLLDESFCLSILNDNNIAFPDTIEDVIIMLNKKYNGVICAH